VRSTRVEKLCDGEAASASRKIFFLIMTPDQVENEREKKKFWVLTVGLACVKYLSLIKLYVSKILSTFLP
jgi:hypothetical protein